MKQPGTSSTQHHHKPPRVIIILLTVALLTHWFGLARGPELCSAQTASVWALGGTTVRSDPLSLDIEAGSTGVASILVKDVADLYAFQFEITFDPALVEVVDADPLKPGIQIEPGGFLSPNWELDNTVDNDSGTIQYALSQRDPSPPRSGSGVLAIITWRGKVVGSSPIHFNFVKLGAPGPVAIPTDTQDGQITVTGPFEIYLSVICQMH